MILISAAAFCCDGSLHATSRQPSSKGQERRRRSILACAAGSSSEQPFFPILPDSLLQRDKEALEVAVNAVVKACHVSYSLQPSDKKRISTITKTDLSPVTVADFAVQAIVLQQLHQSFPDDEFVAEEDAIQLVRDDSLAKQILDATGIPCMADLCYAVNLGQGRRRAGEGQVIEQCTGIKQRVWCLDPIDGTRGFLRGKENDGQFCVALALIEDGVPIIGILGCPNLPWSFDEDVHDIAQEKMPKGCLFVAVKDAGSYQLPLYDSNQNLDLLPRKLAVTPPDGSLRIVAQGRMCTGVEKYSDARGLSARMAHYIHYPEQNDDSIHSENFPNARRVDSQVKYGLIARGDGEFYVRLPRIGYQEWIWDHAAGSVVLEEAGGILTDTDGNPIDFGLGRQLSASIKGILGSNGGVFHRTLLEAYRRAEHELLASEKEMIT